MSEWYRLDVNNVPNRISFDELLARPKDGTWKRVALTIVHEGCEVSTVFLGLDHSWTPGGPPLVFETMVFGGQQYTCLTKQGDQ